jgi:DNA polymerase I-like protein with 3'-5' exonuclease and polymerase domains
VHKLMESVAKPDVPLVVGIGDNWDQAHQLNG